VEIDVSKLLALPAAERLELAEMLRRSVGYPADIDCLLVPEWQRAQMDSLLEKYASKIAD
jgi:hypothetical protein